MDLLVCMYGYMYVQAISINNFKVPTIASKQASYDALRHAVKANKNHYNNNVYVVGDCFVVDGSNSVEYCASALSHTSVFVCLPKATQPALPLSVSNIHLEALPTIVATSTVLAVNYSFLDKLTDFLKSSLTGLFCTLPMIL